MNGLGMLRVGRGKGGSYGLENGIQRSTVCIYLDLQQKYGGRNDKTCNFAFFFFLQEFSDFRDDERRLAIKAPSN